MTTEQFIILAFLAAAFVAGWVVRSLVGMARNGAATRRGEAAAAAAAAAHRVAHPAQLDARRAAPPPHPDARDEVSRAIRAYHAAVISSPPGGGKTGARNLVTLAGALAALSRAVGEAADEAGGQESLHGRLVQLTDELRTLSDEVMVHSRELELPPSILDRLEQHLITAASTIFAPGSARATAV
jgi:hypothetical protein